MIQRCGFISRFKLQKTYTQKQNPSHLIQQGGDKPGNSANGRSESIDMFFVLVLNCREVFQV